MEMMNTLRCHLLPIHLSDKTKNQEQQRLERDQFLKDLPQQKRQCSKDQGDSGRRSRRDSG